MLRDIYEDFKSCCRFLRKPSSWIVLGFAAVLLLIGTGILLSGFDFGLPERLVCSGANDKYLVLLFILGFVFLMLSFAAVGAILVLIENFMARRSVEWSGLWLPSAAMVCGLVSYLVLKTAC